MRSIEVKNKRLNRALTVTSLKGALWLGLIFLFMHLPFGSISYVTVVRPVWAASAEDDSSGSSGEQSGEESADPDEGEQDEQADEEPADDDPADDEADADPADEDPDEGGIGDMDAGDEPGDDDAEDEIADDADDDDDSEPMTGKVTIDKKRALMRRVVLDGLCKLEEFKDGLHRFGNIEKFAIIQQRQNMRSRWSASHSGGTGVGQVRRTDTGGLENNILKNAGRPRYEVGDTYVYSDGSWELVLASNQERVEWRNHYGNVSVGSPDFTYKRSRWKTSNRMGIRTFQQTSYIWDKSTDTLWPLALKNKTRFDEEGRWIGKDGIERRYDSFWRCDVDGTERVEVPAGAFDTWRIRCARYRDSFSYPKSRAREYRTWYYAPAIEHWVRLDRDYRGYRPDVNKELVAILPDLQGLSVNPQTIVQVQQQFQEVLEYNAVDQKDIWMAAGGDVTVVMQPKATFRNEEGIYCRQYVQDVEAPDYAKRYAGIGCRSSRGTWYVPRR